MASIIDQFSTLTLNTQEATQDSDLIKVNPYLTPDIARIHGVQTGVIMDKFIPILGQIEDIGLIDPGSCGTNSFTTAIPVSEKTWTPKLISARIPLCVDDIPAKLKFWIDQQKALGRWENISNPLKQFVYDRAVEAVKRAVIRVAEFADTDAALVSGGGDITNGLTIGLFTMIDGMWKQIFDDDSGSQLIYRHTIDENAGASKAAQLTLASDTAYNTFVALVENFAPEAQSDMPVLQCTKTLWDNWVKYIESKAGAYRIELLQDGTTKETFRGYPIIVRSDWDRMIKRYHDKTSTYLLPHRAILSGINNIPIGTSDTESFSSIDSFYDKTDKKYYTDLAFRVDCKILQESNISVAY
jgi:hypothetical protein